MVIRDSISLCINISNMENKKIQLRAYPKSWVSGDVKEYVLEYRIVPKELNWFKRIFFNHWHSIHCAIWDGVYKLTIKGPGQLNDYKLEFKTEGDIKAFEKDQQRKAERKRKELEAERKRKGRIFY